MFSSMTLLMAFAALAAAAPFANQSPAEPRGLLSGQLTWYTEGMGVSATACGTVHQVTEVYNMTILSQPSIKQAKKKGSSSTLC